MVSKDIITKREDTMMKNKFKILLIALVGIFILGCTSETENKEEITSSTSVEIMQSVQVFTANNIDGDITAKTIESVFESNGLTVDASRNLNLMFTKVFKNTHHKVYNLALFKNTDLNLKLLKKYPNFGVMVPLTMSIWSDGSTVNIATLSLEGMARAGAIPLDDEDLLAYSAMIDKALKSAMPEGTYKKQDKVRKSSQESFLTKFDVTVVLDDDSPLITYKEDFQEELEEELDNFGFLIPNYINLREEVFEDVKYDGYDFYDTYSICKLDLIYSISKEHPEVGAYAPCSFYMYKKKDEDTMHLGFLSVENWITTLGIEDKKLVKELYDAQGIIESVLTQMTE